MRDWIEKLALVIIATLAPIHSVLVAVGVLIMADLVTGVWAAHKRGEKINSAALRRTVSKILIFNLAVISGFVVEKYLLSDIMPVSKIIAGVIGTVELVSILENANTITGTNIFQLLIQKLGSQNDLINKLGPSSQKEKSE